LRKSIPEIREFINDAGLVVDLAGVLIIVVGVLWAAASYIWTPNDNRMPFRVFRKSVGRAILLGLEFLVGGDIIRTVSVDHPALERVAALGMIVIIRIMLSWAMEVELEGCLPWRGKVYQDQASNPVKCI
jgi:uncharacterized membrane protein